MGRRVGWFTVECGYNICPTLNKGCFNCLNVENLTLLMNDNTQLELVTVLMSRMTADWPLQPSYNEEGWRVFEDGRMGDEGIFLLIQLQLATAVCCSTSQVQPKFVVCGFWKKEETELRSECVKEWERGQIMFMFVFNLFSLSMYTSPFLTFSRTHIFSWLRFVIICFAYFSVCWVGLDEAENWFPILSSL